ncbi:putative mitochondrial protein, partial [Nicotiana attenuata]
HLVHLEEAFKVLRFHTMFIKQSKCAFGVTQIDYLGHIISEHGVSMDNQKVKGVLDWPLPSSVKGLRGFLGLTGYYRRFIKGYGVIARPLTDLLKKGNFQWNIEATVSFEELKRAITSAPVLALPDFSKTFTVETDASVGGIGAVLAQDNKPIAFFRGHSGITATLKRLKQDFYWKKMKQDVYNYIRSCDVCQKCKNEIVAYPGLLQPLPIPEKVWQDISMDFIEGLPKVAGKEVIFEVVDRLSKAAHFIALKHPYTALEKPRTWPQWLPLAEWWYNTSYHSSTNMTPYEAVYGQKPPPLLPYMSFDSQLDLVDRSLQAREATIRLLKSHLEKAQNRMKTQADKGKTDRAYAVGDWVYVKLQPYR